MPFKLGKHTVHNQLEFASLPLDDSTAKPLENLYKRTSKDLLFRAKYISTMGVKENTELKALTYNTIDKIRTTTLANFLETMEVFGEKLEKHPNQTYQIGMKNGKFKVLKKGIQAWFARVFGGVTILQETSSKAVSSTERRAELTENQINETELTVQDLFSATVLFLEDMHFNGITDKVDFRKTQESYQTFSKEELQTEHTHIRHIHLVALRFLGTKSYDEEQRIHQDLESIKESLGDITRHIEERNLEQFGEALGVVGALVDESDRHKVLIGNDHGRIKLYERGADSFFAKLAGTSFKQFGVNSEGFKEFLTDYIATLETQTNQTLGNPADPEYFTKLQKLQNRSHGAALILQNIADSKALEQTQSKETAIIDEDLEVALHLVNDVFDIDDEDLLHEDEFSLDESIDAYDVEDYTDPFSEDFYLEEPLTSLADDFSREESWDVDVPMNKIDQLKNSIDTALTNLGLDSTRYESERPTPHPEKTDDDFML